VQMESVALRRYRHELVKIIEIFPEILGNYFNSDSPFFSRAYRILRLLVRAGEKLLFRRREIEIPFDARLEIRRVVRKARRLGEERCRVFRSGGRREIKTHKYRLF